MKLFAVLAVIFAVSSFARCDEETDDSSSSTEMLAEIVSAVLSIGDSSEENGANETTIVRNTIEKICPGQGTSLEEAIRKTVQCDEAETLTDKTTCTYIKTNLGTCVQPIVKELEKCVPETESYAPKMIVDTIIALLSWVCDSTGETLLELINPCIDLGEMTDECIKELKEKAQPLHKNPKEITKNNVCDYLKVHNSCIGTLTSKCKVQKTKDAVQGLANALASQCNAA